MSEPKFLTWDIINKLGFMNGRDRYKAIKNLTLDEKLEMFHYMNLDELREYGVLFDKDMKNPKPSKEQVEACDDLINDYLKQIFIETHIHKRMGEFKIYPDLYKRVRYLVVKDIDAGVYDNREITEKDVSGYIFG